MSNQFETAWEGIEKSWASQKLAHGYLLQGAPHGAALRFVEKLLNLIFDSHPQVQMRTHPDLMWLEPQSKSRRIGIDDVRDLIQQLSQTAFSGGWKAAVFIGADRMTPEAANAFLKTLEEPPPKTLLILVTDEPQSLLPTITSRCQKIVLNEGDEEISTHWKEPLINILRELPPGTASEASLLAARLAAMLKELYMFFENEEKERIPEDLTAKEAKTLLEARSTARMIEARSDILRTLLKWQRDVLFLVLKQDSLYFQEEKSALMAQANCSRAVALQRLESVDEMSRQLDRNLPAELVFNSFFSRFVR